MGSKVGMAVMYARLHRQVFVVGHSFQLPPVQLDSESLKVIMSSKSCDIRPAAQVLVVGDFFQLPPVQLERTDFAFNSW